MYEGDEIQLSVFPVAESILWVGNAILGSATASPAVLVPDQSQWVYCEVKEGNCAVMDSVWIRVEEWNCGEGTIFIPNAFSPNENGENDQLKVHGVDGQTMSLMIYDRWGNEVFSTHDPDAAWDGTYEGKLLQSAVFHFVLKVNCGQGREYQKEGNITLMR